MKFNKWTLGLAAVGVVSLASAARADEKMNALQTALSNTTISGYVSASFNWAIAGGAFNNDKVIMLKVGLTRFHLRALSHSKMGNRTASIWTW